MEQNQHLEDLAKIRSLMEKSTRFLSLSGLSGVFAGLYALAGSWVAHSYLHSKDFISAYAHLVHPLQLNGILMHYSFFLILAIMVAGLSILTGILFTFRKARKRGDTIWNHSSKRMATNLIIPLLAGAVFCMQLINLGLPGLVGPALLIFYGMALINGSKYTLEDIRYLGIIEVALGLVNLFFIGWGLYFFALGFGILHIIYGVYMYYKYEA